MSHTNSLQNIDVVDQSSSTSSSPTTVLVQEQSLQETSSSTEPLLAPPASTPSSSIPTNLLPIPSNSVLHHVSRQPTIPIDQYDVEPFEEALNNPSQQDFVLVFHSGTTILKDSESDIPQMLELIHADNQDDVLMGLIRLYFYLRSTLFNFKVVDSTVIPLIPRLTELLQSADLAIVYQVLLLCSQSHRSGDWTAHFTFQFINTCDIVTPFIFHPHKKISNIAISAIRHPIHFFPEMLLRKNILTPIITYLSSTAEIPFSQVETFAHLLPSELKLIFDGDTSNDEDTDDEATAIFSTSLAFKSTKITNNEQVLQFVEVLLPHFTPYLHVSTTDSFSALSNLVPLHPTAIISYITQHNLLSNHLGGNIEVSQEYLSSIIELISGIIPKTDSQLRQSLLQHKLLDMLLDVTDSTSKNHNEYISFKCFRILHTLASGDADQVEFIIDNGLFKIINNVFSVLFDEPGTYFLGCVIGMQLMRNVVTNMDDDPKLQDKIVQKLFHEEWITLIVGSFFEPPMEDSPIRILVFFADILIYGSQRSIEKTINGEKQIVNLSVLKIVQDGGLRLLIKWRESFDEGTLEFTLINVILKKYFEGQY